MTNPQFFQTAFETSSSKNAVHTYKIDTQVNYSE